MHGLSEHYLLKGSDGAGSLVFPLFQPSTQKANSSIDWTHCFKTPLYLPELTRFNSDLVSPVSHQRTQFLGYIYLSFGFETLLACNPVEEEANIRSYSMFWAPSTWQNPNYKNGWIRPIVRSIVVK